MCLHEETHRTQFTSVPWLRGYVQEQISEFLLASDLDPATILGRLRSAADAVAGAVRDGGGDSVLEAIQSPRQREILDRLTSVMTLVEGHGDYVMDAVGPQVVPSVEQIRQRFNERRGTGGRIERTLRRILGIDLKMKQYAQGSRFVKAVVEEAGMATFNKVWTSPQTLPTKDEFVHPELWLDRVGRGGALGRRRLTGHGPAPAVAQARACVRRLPRRSGARGPGAGRLLGGRGFAGPGGCARHEAPRLGLRGGGVTVDHGLQEGSAAQDSRVEATLLALGLDPVRQVPVGGAARGRWPGSRSTQRPVHRA